MIIIKTSFGEIQLQLDTENTPETTKNFLSYVHQGFYDNTIFHRVISGFMIQGGGMLDNMEQKKNNSPIKNEAKNAKPNHRGTIAMARTMDPHSATAQFFINLVNNNFLNFSAESAQGYGYCVFGEVIAGMDVVDKIAKVATGSRMGHGDVPLETVLIEKITAIES